MKPALLLLPLGQPFPGSAWLVMGHVYLWTWSENMKMDGAVGQALAVPLDTRKDLVLCIGMDFFGFISWLGSTWLEIYFFHQIWQIFSHYFFKDFLNTILFFLSSRDLKGINIRSFVHSHKRPRLCSLYSPATFSLLFKLDNSYCYVFKLPHAFSLPCSLCFWSIRGLFSVSHHIFSALRVPFYCLYFFAKVLYFFA